jgi:signal transduction histidine kinase
MPREIAMRVFQRHFTTKQGTGRGLGTYAMKLLGERHLGGTVDFESDAASGTVFRIALPLIQERPSAVRSFSVAEAT